MPPELAQLAGANDWLKSISRHDLVYLSGPMSGVPELNRPAFFLWEHLIKLRGCRVLTPARAIQSKMYNVLLREGLAMVLLSNVVVMLKGWEASVGANSEWSLANLVGNRIYYEK